MGVRLDRGPQALDGTQRAAQDRVIALAAADMADEGGARTHFVDTGLARSADVSDITSPGAQ